MRLKRCVITTICVVSFLAPCATFLLVQHSKAHANKLFANMTYFTGSPYIVEKVTLVNGIRETENHLLHHYMHYKDQYVYGDFNRDGMKDAAVIISQGEGGSGDFRELAFLIGDGERFVHRSSKGLGDRVRINSLKERDGKVVIDMFVHQEGDCMAWPTKRINCSYEYSENKNASVAL